MELENSSYHQENANFDEESIARGYETLGIKTGSDLKSSSKWTMA